MDGTGKTVGTAAAKAAEPVKKILCRIGWHSPGYDLVEYDGNSGICNKYRCRWCGRTGLVDSQGNLF